MTIWTASVGEILELSADALICSANPQLNLSGGVGGEFLLRYGESMQHFLHDWLRALRLGSLESFDYAINPEFVDVP